MAKDLYLVLSATAVDENMEVESEHKEMGDARTRAKYLARDDANKTYYVAQVMAGFQATVSVAEI